ncbi:hypothetical protein CORC01_03020 [Colletotrichum orchidophilum]|uniref:FAD binding domain-containing protein n=1 Tax=Colletotrichum orchidophilum TaxID=1209926 RepID=A0A1G4BK60_9PEZI|nr:uncharacterized protein CORC01_03020 [Colletotrichum orchidophilum]OHF01829.1 hypothetical protein CORC01_03020 [Colletotrichum orchidophilum]
MPASMISESKRVASQAAASLVQSVRKERDKVVVRTGSSDRGKKHGLAEEMTQSVAAGIGIISEAMHHRKEKKTEASDRAESPPLPGIVSRTDSEPKLLDGGTAKLDGNDQEVEMSMPLSSPANDTRELASEFIERHPCTITGEPGGRQRLSLPVLVPQRRPEKRARGFIRAYAPMLADVGIDQDMFFDLIDTFNKSLEPNPWINAFNLAGFAGEALPDPASLLFGFAVENATEAIMEGQSLFCSNKFLNCVNAEVFIPRGLVCLVVTWQPDNDGSQVTANLVEVVKVPLTKPFLFQGIPDVAAGRTSSSKGWQEMKMHVGELMRPTGGDFNWPEPAPLIYPNLECSAQKSDVGVKKKNAWDRMEDWINGHSDKRAQASWIEENKGYPTMNLMPKPKFRSRYADPNHPASSGDLVSLITGGRWRFTNDGKAKSKIQTEKTSEERSNKERENQKKKKGGSEKNKKRRSLEAERGGKVKGEKHGMTDCQKGGKKTHGRRSHKKDIEVEFDLGSGGVKEDHAEEAKTRAASLSKPSGVFKGLFQKDVLYLAILSLSYEEKSTKDWVGRSLQ